ncbi:hypothetical protein [Sediminitomix flava]|uniref:Dolichyl-phosphate-mannose-protein mannosyltransferase n=1 Tax=Sediminitomix flava TaxID=379075 RepID=A0A316A0V7_SEDFL|nr:hypothetical protein [Sediminitomix flava]PWJ43287.1 hypothetical protein BC781_102836 [Sediminitomix flava]
MKSYLTFWDFLLAPIYLAIVYWIAGYFAKRWTNKYTKKYFYWGLHAKLFGAFAFTMVYAFYYGGGDTFVYVEDAKKIFHVFLDNPITGVKVFFLEAKELTNDTFQYTSRFWMFSKTSNWAVAKIASIIGLFTFANYLPTSFFFALFSFLGIWKVYQFFVSTYPQLYKELALLSLFIPSTLFWSSSVLKETITSGAIGFFLYYSTQLFFKQKDILKSMIICLCMYILIKDIKGITITAFLPCLMIWLFQKYQQSLGTAGKVGTTLILFLSLPVILLAISSGITNQIEESEAFQETQSKVIGFHTDHGRAYMKGHGGGLASSYQLSGMGDASINGMLRSIPEAVNVTLFRPYLWEVRKPVQFVGALESFAFLIMTLYLLLKAGPIKFFKQIFSNPEVALCISYSILFGFIVGFTSFNFGVLQRFKTPLLPFYTIGLYLIYKGIPTTKKKSPSPRKRKTLLH